MRKPIAMHSRWYRGRMSCARWEKLVRKASEWFLEMNRQKCRSSCDEMFPRCEQLTESWHTPHLMIIDKKICPNSEDVIDLGDLEFTARGDALVKVQVWSRADEKKPREEIPYEKHWRMRRCRVRLYRVWNATVWEHAVWDEAAWDIHVAREWLDLSLWRTRIFEG